MRGLLALALLALLLPGCTKNADPPATAQAPVQDAPQPLPQPIHATQAVSASADPTNAVTECTAPTAQCFQYPFDLARDANVSLALAWGLQANDFDLYLYEGDTQVDRSAGGPTTQEAIATQLGPGSYLAVVDGYAVGQDTFTLDITFA